MSKLCVMLFHSEFSFRIHLLLMFAWTERRNESNQKRKKTQNRINEHRFVLYLCTENFPKISSHFLLLLFSSTLTFSLCLSLSGCYHLLSLPLLCSSLNFSATTTTAAANATDAAVGFSFWLTSIMCSLILNFCTKYFENNFHSHAFRMKRHAKTRCTLFEKLFSICSSMRARYRRHRKCVVGRYTRWLSTIVINLKLGILNYFTFRSKMQSKPNENPYGLSLFPQTCCRCAGVDTWIVWSDVDIKMHPKFLIVFEIVTFYVTSYFVKYYKLRFIFPM